MATAAQHEPGFSPASAWDDQSRKRALDELFTSARAYSRSADYLDLMSFVSRFKRYSPFNGMLVHIQKPGATFVLSSSDWAEKYHRDVKPGAQPLVILKPMGPVMFVFDVSDTEPAAGALPLPLHVTAPFEVSGSAVGPKLARIIAQCARDGVRVHSRPLGSQQAGSIRWSKNGGALVVFRDEPLPVCYELILNSTMSEAAQYATLAHELGHLYCGHLGTVNAAWWPDRRGLSVSVREFEAESVSYLVCTRAGIDTSSGEYLHGYLESNDEVPAISLDRVFVAAGLIEKMSERSMGLR